MLGCSGRNGIRHFPILSITSSTSRSRQEALRNAGFDTLFPALALVRPGKMGPGSEASRTGLGLSFLGRLDQAGPLSFEAGEGSASPAFSFRDPVYGRDPVGNGHAAAGF